MSSTGGLVYVVDDDVSVREGVASLIRSAGIGAKALASGQEFLAIPRPEIPSCLVLDVELPGLSGLEVQQELVRSGVRIPIIFLTGHGDIPMSVRAIQAGATDFLTKPFDGKELLSAIRRCIGVRFASGDDRLHGGSGSHGRLPNSLAVLEASGRANQEFDPCMEERRKERARIARELHDTLFQGFFSASMVLQTAVEAMPANSPSKSSLNRALQLMRRVIDDGRAALQELRSPRIPFASLEQALADRRNEFPLASAQFRILVTGHRKALDPAIQEEINLIAREALANAFHHSNATKIEAEIEHLPGKLRVVIRDDGRGMDPQTVRLRQNSHWGLQGMRERARSIGAHLQIWSKPGLGTEVEVSYLRRA